MDTEQQQLDLLKSKVAALQATVAALSTLVIGTTVEAWSAKLDYLATAPAASQAGFRTLLSLTPGTDVQPQNADLAAIAALDATAGLLAKTGAATYARRTLTAPAAGLSISNPAGTAGNPTFALANDLSALEGLASTGFAVRSAADTWVQRSFTSGTGISISNPDGVAGNPTITCTVTGAYGDGSTIKAADGLVGTPGLTFNSDPDNGAYRIGTNNWALTVGGAKALELSAAGNVTKPLQAAFEAYNSTADTNQTGDGTTVTIQFDTETYDVGGNFASNTFTAPVSGFYLLAFNARLTSIGALHTNVLVDIVTSNRTYYVINANSSAEALASGTLTIEAACIAYLDAADTAFVEVTVTGSTKTVGIDGGGGASAGVTNFRGILLA